MNPLLRAAIALGTGALVANAVTPAKLSPNADAYDHRRTKVTIGILIALGAWLAAPTIINGKPL